MIGAGVIIMIIGVLLLAAAYIRDVWLIEVKDTPGMIYLLFTDFLLYGSAIALILIPPLLLF